MIVKPDIQRDHLIFTGYGISTLPQLSKGKPDDVNM